MADVNTILKGEALSLKRIIVDTWNGDGTYGDPDLSTRVPFYGSVSLTVNVDSIQAQRYGDGSVLLASVNKKTGGSGTLEWAGDMTSLAKVLGLDVTTSGITPDRLREMWLTGGSTPYLGFVASSDLDSGVNNGVQIFAPKMQVASDSINILSWTGGQEVAYGTVSMDVVFLVDDNWVSGGDNLIQNISLGTPSEGTYTIRLGNYVTTALAYNANAAAVEAALELLPNVGTGGVNVTTGTPTGMDVEFTGRLAGENMPLFVITGAGGFNGTPVVTRKQNPKASEPPFMGIFEVEGGYALELPPVFVQPV